MCYDVRIHLSIGSVAAISADKMQDLLGIKADSILRIGSRRLVPSPIPVKNAFILKSSPPKKDAALEEHWEYISIKILPKEDLLMSLKEKLNCKITVTVDLKSGVPALKFPLEMIEFCTRIGSIIDVDIYDGE